MSVSWVDIVTSSIISIFARKSSMDRAFLDVGLSLNSPTVAGPSNTLMHIDIPSPIISAGFLRGNLLRRLLEVFVSLVILDGRRACQVLWLLSSWVDRDPVLQRNIRRLNWRRIALTLPT